jgi:hypothetical protein
MVLYIIQSDVNFHKIYLVVIIIIYSNIRPNKHTYKEHIHALQLEISTQNKLKKSKKYW